MGLYSINDEESYLKQLVSRLEMLGERFLSASAKLQEKIEIEKMRIQSVRRINADTDLLHGYPAEMSVGTRKILMSNFGEASVAKKIIQTYGLVSLLKLDGIGKRRAAEAVEILFGKDSRQVYVRSVN